MKSFDEFFLMTTDDVKRYAVEVLHKFAPDEGTECIEIGDGNINYVFKIWSKKDGHSEICKWTGRQEKSKRFPSDADVCQISLDEIFLCGPFGTSRF